MPTYIKLARMQAAWHMSLRAQEDDDRAHWCTHALLAVQLTACRVSQPASLGLWSDTEALSRHSASA